MRHNNERSMNQSLPCLAYKAIRLNITLKRGRRKEGGAPQVLAPGRVRVQFLETCVCCFVHVNCCVNCVGLEQVVRFIQ